LFKKNISAEQDITQLELFTNRFMSIADNMGVLLQRTSLSVNVKERLDFSCALLDHKPNSLPMRRISLCIWGVWVYV
jgi:N-methylhydantoinase B/oxoprolinase/acetone carboxylase alpha subunit